MIQRLSIIAIFLIFTQYATAQLVDKYGINIGLSYSKQLWDYKKIAMSNDIDYKPGLAVFLSAEKKINKTFSLRPEIGYIQKGFKNKTELYFNDGTSGGGKNKNIIFHNLAANLGLKITPFTYRIAPYALFGIRYGYMIAYKDIVVEEPVSGLKFNMYKDIVEDFNKSNVGGLIAVGVELKNLTYLEFSYNPTLTKSYNNSLREVKDICWELKIGLNINNN